MEKTFSIYLMVLLVAGLMAGCGHWDSGGTTATLTAINVTPPNPTIPKDLTR